MRATSITDALKDGARPEDMRQAARHSDPSTTQLYDRRRYDPEKVANIVPRASRNAGYIIASPHGRHMTKWKRALGLSVALVSGASISSALAQQLNSQQIEVIRDTAASICNTVKEAKGQKSDYQIEGDVKAQLGGLAGKLVDVVGSGKGSVSREEFEGLSRDSTAAALEGDRGCRKRLFKEMFDKLTTPPAEKKSGMSKAEKLIAIVDLGYTFSDISRHCSSHRLRPHRLRRPQGLRPHRPRTRSNV